MKVVFCSSIETPTMSELCAKINDLCDAYFLFYSKPTSRPNFWSRSTNFSRCFVAEKSYEPFDGFYYSSDLFRKLKDLKPDVVVLGGILIPTNLLIYRWCIQNEVSVFIFSEPFGFGGRFLGKIKYFQSAIFSYAVKFFFGGISGVFAVGEAGYQDFKRIFASTNIPVVKTQYPVTITPHLRHPFRRPSCSPKLLFPHRLVDIYDPLLAVTWFAEILKEFPDAHLGLNAFGDKRGDVSALISRLGISQSINFLDNIQTWNDLHNVYKNHDLVLSTKTGRYRSPYNSWGDSDWSMAEMEACASGMGLIVSDCSVGLTNAMRKSGAGFIVENPNDSKSVVAGYRAYAQDPDLLVEHGKLLRDEVKQFNVEAYAQTFVGSIHSLRGIVH